VGISVGAKPFAYGNRWNRIQGCYLDGEKGELLLEDPTELVVERNFFLGSRTRLKAGGHRWVRNLLMHSNMYSSAPPSVAVEGTFSQVQSVDISGELSGDSEAGETPLSTRVAQSLTLTAATSWSFDFSKRLVFPPSMAELQQLVYSVVFNGDGGFVQHAARRDGHKVVVYTAAPANATVTVEVAQGTP